MNLLTLIQPAGAATTGTPGSTPSTGTAGGADGFEQLLFGLLAPGQAALRGALLGGAAAAKTAAGSVGLLAGATGTQPGIQLEAGGTALTGAAVLGVDGILPSVRSGEHTQQIAGAPTTPLPASANTNPVTAALAGVKSSFGQGIAAAATAKTAAQAVPTPDGIPASANKAAATLTSAASGQARTGPANQQGAATSAAGSAVTAALNEKSAGPGESAKKPASPVARLSEVVTAKTTIKSAVIDAPGAGKKSAAKTAGWGAKDAKTGGSTRLSPQARNGLSVARAVQAAQAGAKANMVKPQSSSGKSPVFDLFAPAPASVFAAGGEGATVVSVSSITAGTGAEQATQTAAARAAAPSTPVAQQVAVQFSQALANGADRITIQLHPQSLGRVEVEIELTKDGRLTAIFIAERPETLEMLQRDSRALERALNEAGVRTDADGFSFSLRGEGRQAQQSDNSPGGSGGGEFDAIGGEELVTPRAPTLNANALLDIQV